MATNTEKEKAKIKETISTSFNAYKNGSIVLTSFASTSVGIPPVTFYVGSVNVAGAQYGNSIRQYAGWSAGGFLTASEIAIKHALEKDYNLALGIV